MHLPPPCSGIKKIEANQASSKQPNFRLCPDGDLAPQAKSFDKLHERKTGNSLGFDDGSNAEN